MGEELYTAADRLLICADGGGQRLSVAAGTVELRRRADETGLEATVCHLPPGIGKWNKIEHRLLWHITMN